MVRRATCVTGAASRGAAGHPSDRRRETWCG